MKKVILLILTVIILLTPLIGCSPIYENWKVMKIDGCGTIKIPNEWILTEKDEKIYLTDISLDESNVIAFFIQSHSYAGIDIGHEGIIESNQFSDSFQSLKCESSAVISNGAVYGEVLNSIDGVEKKMLCLELSGAEKRVQLFAWNDAIDKDMLVKIAKSFEEV